MWPWKLLALYQIILVSASNTSEQGKEEVVIVDSDLRTSPKIYDISSLDGSDDEIQLPNSNGPIQDTSPAFNNSPTSQMDVIDIVDDDKDDNSDSEDGKAVENCISEEVQSLFPHSVGIRNHALNCYASALISCLYNIPTVQMALFDEVSRFSLRKEESVIMALATIFYKMRFGKSFIDLEPFFMTVVRRSIGWKFGGLECVLEFWNRLSMTLPESLFQIESQENRFRKSDGLLIKSVPQKSNLILVSPSKKYRNIEEFLQNEFVDEDAEDFKIEPADRHEYPHLTEVESAADGEVLYIPSKTSLTILNCPKVLIFGVKRVRWNPETNSSVFDSTHLGFPEKLTINGEEYTIVGNIEYDATRVHYFARNHDILDDQWYIHDDKNVEMIPDTEEAFDELTKRFIHNSSMVFYVKSSLLEEVVDKSSVVIPKEVVTKLTSRSRTRLTSESPKLKRKRRDNTDKEEQEQPEILVESQFKTKIVREEIKVPEEKIIKKVRGPYKKRCKAVDVMQEQQTQAENSVTEPENSLTETKKILAEAKKSSGEDAAAPAKKRRAYGRVYEKHDNVYFKSSLVPIVDFRLGSKSFLFSTVDRNIVLELILMAYASNAKAVRVLFEASRSMVPTDLSFKFALVILRMLSGHLGIDVSALSKELIETYQVDFSDISLAWRQISQLLPQEISPHPSLKLISYENDEPISIGSIPKCDFYSVKPFKNVACPSHLKLSGPAYDLGEATGYRRNILNSDGIILPIPVTRYAMNAEDQKFDYDTAPINVNSGEYQIYGFIGIKPQTRGAFASFFHPEGLLIYTSGVPAIKGKSAQVQEIIAFAMRHQSVMLFLSKPEDFKLEMPMLSDVPRILLDELALSN